MDQAEIGGMLDKMEAAMSAMASAMDQARAEDRTRGGGAREREALVSRVQGELRAVMDHLPPPVRQSISPDHPTLFGALTRELTAEMREFIRSWADGVRSHGSEFEQWVRDRNRADEAFRFMHEPASADARYYQACLSGRAPPEPEPEPEPQSPREEVAGRPATASGRPAARRTPRRDVFRRLASPPSGR